MKIVDKLKPLFDEVLVDTSKEDYIALICQNNVNKGVIKKEVWLELRVRKETSLSSRTPEENINAYVEDILLYKEALFKTEKKNVQYSLFTDELEYVEPEPNRETDYTAWSTWKENEKTKKRNDANFLEAFPFSYRNSYSNASFAHQLPTNNEIINLIRR